MGRIFVNSVDMDMDPTTQDHEGYWSGTGHVFIFLNGFGARVIRFKPASLTCLSAQIQMLLKIATSTPYKYKST